MAMAWPEIQLAGKCFFFSSDVSVRALVVLPITFFIGWLLVNFLLTFGIKSWKHLRIQLLNKHICT